MNAIMGEPLAYMFMVVIGFVDGYIMMFTFNLKLEIVKETIMVGRCMVTGVSIKLNGVFWIMGCCKHASSN